MSDAYQAIYDATRSKINGGNAYDAIYTATREMFDISFAKERMEEEMRITQYELRRPSVIYRPALYPDGNQWCALYGENLQEGVAGFGDTPAQAMQQFDIEWLNQKCGPKPNQEE